MISYADLFADIIRLGESKCGSVSTLLAIVEALSYESNRLGHEGNYQRSLAYAGGADALKRFIDEAYPHVRERS